MSTAALIVRDDATLSASYTEEAERIKNEALEISALVARVSNAEEQNAAVAAQKAINGVLSVAEKARKACKEPVLMFGQKIDSAAKTFVQDLHEEQMRLAKLVGDFQTLEQDRVRKAQAAENMRLSALERERMAQAAKATTHQELEQVHRHFDIRAKDESVAVQPTRAPGQVVAEGWEFEVVDLWAMVRWVISSGNTECLKVEPKITEVKNLLKAGVQIPGIKAWKAVQSGVRAGPAQKALNV